MAKRIMVKTKEKEEFFNGECVKGYQDEDGNLQIEDDENPIGLFLKGSWEYVRKLK